MAESILDMYDDWAIVAKAVRNDYPYSLIKSKQQYSNVGWSRLYKAITDQLDYLQELIHEDYKRNRIQ